MLGRHTRMKQEDNLEVVRDVKIRARGGKGEKTKGGGLKKILSIKEKRKTFNVI